MMVGIMQSHMIKVRIKEVAESRGITTAYQLQKATGVYPSMALKWFKNDLKAVDLKTLNLLCRVLKCQPEDLLEYTPDAK
jgi:DNA-binding Xre family transcriptional regulator